MFNKPNAYLDRYSGRWHAHTFSDGDEYSIKLPLHIVDNKIKCVHYLEAQGYDVICIDQTSIEQAEADAAAEQANADPYAPPPILWGRVERTINGQKHYWDYEQDKWVAC